MAAILSRPQRVNDVVKYDVDVTQAVLILSII